MLTKATMNWKKTGVNCIGIKDTGENFQINPPDAIQIAEGMKILIMGTRQQIGGDERKFTAGLFIGGILFSKEAVSKAFSTLRYREKELHRELIYN